MNGTAVRDVPRTPIAESLRRLETLVSPYTGIVRAVHATLAATDDAPLVTAACELADTRLLVGAGIDANAVSWSTDRTAALVAALGEAAERYSAGFVPEKDIVLATAEELGADAVDPSRFALFHPRQLGQPGFRASPFTRRTRVRWVQGFSVSSGRPAWLPVQLVYLAGLPVVEGEELIGYATSNGLACRPTLEEAILSGLLEVVERDAFAIAWYNRLSLPRLETGDDPRLNRFVERYLAPAGLGCVAVDLSVFHRVPTVLALVRGSARELVALAVGAASAPSAVEAWEKAAAEAYATRAWARQLRLEDPGRRFDGDFGAIADFDDHVRLYALRRFARRAAFLASSIESLSVDDVPALEGDRVRDRIEAILRRLSERGDTAGAYGVDVSAPDVRAAGLSVVKVLVPELCQLDVLHGARFLGGRRLYDVACRLGLRAAPLDWEELNPYPHPFP